MAIICMYVVARLSDPKSRGNIDFYLFYLIHVITLTDVLDNNDNYLTVIRYCWGWRSY